MSVVRVSVGQRVWRLSLCLDTQPAAIRAARRLVSAAARHAGANESTAREIEVAVGEALANVCIHAYGNGVGPTDIELGFDGTHFEIRVRDRGRPVAPVRIPTTLRGDGERGRGLYLISRLMDGAEIAHAQGTVLRMVKRVRQESPSSGP